jgi:hypothetical protein
MDTIKAQRFGVEIEMTGISREDASKKLAGLWGTNSTYAGHKTWKTTDTKGRTWMFERDGSISSERKVNGQRMRANDDLSTEMVTPILNYEDIELLQDAVRTLRKAGALVNESCGIHVHVDAANHNAKSLRNLVNIMASKDDLLYRALQIDHNREYSYAKKVESNLVEQVNRIKPETTEALASIWYKGNTTNRYYHYDNSRYHGLNLHAVWSKGTAEFRLFNSTLHAGEVKAYIQLCLAISAQAIAQKSARPEKTTSTNEKFTFRTWLLRLGLIGDEFDTCRKHLLENLQGDAGHRYANAA